MLLDGVSDGRLSSSEKGELLFQTFTLSLDYLYPLFECQEISRLKHLVDNFSPVKVYSRNSPVALKCQELLARVNPEQNLEHRGQLLIIATAILCVEFKLIESQCNRLLAPAGRMRKAFVTLSAEELRNLSVDQLAQRFHCGRRHLNRLFQANFGTSVAALKMEIRLLKVVSLLRDAEIKIINVAEQCGFNHLGLFNTLFKRRFGTSPGAWRRLHQQRGQSEAVLIAGGNVCPLKSKDNCLWASWSAKLPGRNGASPATAERPETSLSPFLRSQNKN